MFQINHCIGVRKGVAAAIKTLYPAKSNNTNIGVNELLTNKIDGKQAHVRAILQKFIT